MGNAALVVRDGSRGVLGHVTLKVGEQAAPEPLWEEEDAAPGLVPVDKGQALVEQSARFCVASGLR